MPVSAVHMSQDRASLASRLVKLSNCHIPLKYTGAEEDIHVRLCLNPSYQVEVMIYSHPSEL